MGAPYLVAVPFVLADGTVVPAGSTLDLEDDVAALHSANVSPVAEAAE